MKNSLLHGAVVNMASLVALQLNSTSVNTGWLWKWDDVTAKKKNK